ncbi:DUF6415 family natural product biosynthesis protein [Streptomyces noursei]|uniref:DUF6415 family natural product biosynthesis protein n=1 Tax=Streptomyces noursei TaxID=1971 RepID=UPI0030EFAAA6
MDRPSNATLDVPIDANTIADTIRRALGFGASRPSREELADTDEELRGHVALLLDAMRRTAACRMPNSFETQHLTKRMDQIEQQLAHPFGQGVLPPCAEVHQRARDCQWLLAHHTARVGW